MVRLFYNNGWYEITSIIDKTINIDRRIDEALDSGSFSFISRIFTFNIPPFTLCEIDGMYFFMSTEATEIITMPGCYTHQATLIELTKILECYILGSKTFTNNHIEWSYGGVKYDLNNNYAKLLVLLLLMNDKYNLDYDFSRIDNIDIYNSTISREFFFGPGTTFFDAMLEIGRSMQMIPRLVYKNSKYSIVFDNLKKHNSFVLDENKIISKVITQNVDEYCSMVECEASDVVDRTNLTKVENLTPRADDVELNSDSMKLILPTRAEEIVKFEAKSPFPKRLVISIPLDSHIFNVENVQKAKSLGTIGIILEPNTKDNIWSKDNGYEGYFYFSALIGYLNEECGYNIDSKSDYPVVIDIKEGMVNLIVGNLSLNAETADFTLGYIDYAIDLTPYLLEKKQYDLIDVVNQANYCYYTTNTPYIEGIYNKQNTTLYKKLIYGVNGPFLRKASQNILGIHSSEDLNINYDNICRYTGTYDFDYKDLLKQIKVYSMALAVNNDLYKTKAPAENPLDNAFNVIYKPITKCLLNSDKDIAPLNENARKTASRTYEGGAGIIDIDNAITELKNVANKQGNEIMSIGYLGNILPNPGDKIIIDSNDWYVSSIQTTINNNLYTSIINLSRCEFKIAESIGVATQFESTYNPDTMILDRIIALKGPQINPDKEYLLCVNYDGNKVYKRVVKLIEAHKAYLIVEAKDNYAFDSYAEATTFTDSLNINVYVEKEVPYSRSNNFMDNYTFTLYEMPNISQKASFRLPLMDNESILPSPLFMATKAIYKDSRERLIIQIGCDIS